MDLIRAASPTVSTSSSLDSNGLPHCRIQCDKKRILVGSKKFQSATDALVAYLNQFDLNDGQHSPAIVAVSPNPGSDRKSNADPLGVAISVNGMKAGGVQATDKGISGSGLVMGPNGLRLEDNKEEVENLLTSKVPPELKEEVTDTLREVKLRHLLKKAAMKSQTQTKTGLQQEVEAALARSAKLLEKVTREDFPSTKAAVSDISDASFSTQALLALNGGSSDDSILSLESVESRERKNGHVYSYRHSPIKTTPLSPSPSSQRRPSRHGARRGSIDSLLPPHELVSPQAKGVSLSSSSNSLSNNSDPSDIIKRIRSRSVPPRLHKQQPQSRPLDWLSQLDRSVSKSVPSWVKSMSPSEISDSAWVPPRGPSQRSAIPSWVEEVDKSDISIDISALDSFPGIPVESMSRPAAMSPTSFLKTQKGNGVNVSYLSTESKADLSYRALSPTLSPMLNSSKRVTFGDNELFSGPAANPPIHSTPISRGRRSHGQQYSIRTLSPSKVLDSEFNGEAYLRNSILPQTARLKKSMENFASSTDNLRKSPSSNSSDASSDHKCSSLDTFALLTGKTVLKADAHKPKNKGNALFPDSPAISSILPEGSQGHLSNGHSSSDGLDGDRPWEAMTNTFKPPVPVGRGEADLFNSSVADAGALRNLSQSLSGGNQPGSMEALKNMLFKLQAEENCVQKNNAKTENSNGGQSPPFPAAIPALQDYNFQMEPGGHSLEKALLHLNRLKTLVKNTGVPIKTNTEASTNERNGHDTGQSGADENEKSS